MHDQLQAEVIDVTRSRTLRERLKPLSFRGGMQADRIAGTSGSSHCHADLQQEIDRRDPASSWKTTQHYQAELNRREAAGPRACTISCKPR